MKRSGPSLPKACSHPASLGLWEGCSNYSSTTGTLASGIQPPIALSTHFPVFTDSIKVYSLLRAWLQHTKGRIWYKFTKHVHSFAHMQCGENTCWTSTPERVFKSKSNSFILETMVRVQMPPLYSMTWVHNWIQILGHKWIYILSWICTTSWTYEYVCSMSWIYECVYSRSQTWMYEGIMY